MRMKTLEWRGGRACDHSCRDHLAAGRLRRVRACFGFEDHETMATVRGAATPAVGRARGRGMLSLLAAISGSGTSPFSSGSLSLLIAGLRLWVLFWVALDLAIVGWTFKDARRRIEDPVIVAVSVASAAVFPFVGALIYVIVRPPEYLMVARERDLENRVMERGLGVDRRTASARTRLRTSSSARTAGSS